MQVQHFEYPEALLRTGARPDNKPTGAGTTAVLPRDALQHVRAMPYGTIQMDTLSQVEAGTEENPVSPPLFCKRFDVPTLEQEGGHCHNLWISWSGLCTSPAPFPSPSSPTKRLCQELAASTQAPGMPTAWCWGVVSISATVYYAKYGHLKDGHKTLCRDESYYEPTKVLIWAFGSPDLFERISYEPGSKLHIKELHKNCIGSYKQATIGSI